MRSLKNMEVSRCVLEMVAGPMVMLASLLVPVRVFARELTCIGVAKREYGTRLRRIAVAARFGKVKSNGIHKKNSRLTAVEEMPGMLFFRFQRGSCGIKHEEHEHGELHKSESGHGE